MFLNSKMNWVAKAKRSLTWKVVGDGHLGRDVTLCRCCSIGPYQSIKRETCTNISVKKSISKGAILSKGSPISDINLQNIVTRKIWLDRRYWCCHRCCSRTCCYYISDPTQRGRNICCTRTKFQIHSTGFSSSWKKKNDIL